jgi:FtsZ-interacting cell division protein YlmF
VLRHEEKAFSGFIEATERPEGKATEGESKNTKTMKNPEKEQKQEDRTKENEHEREIETSRRKEYKLRKSSRPEPALPPSSSFQEPGTLIYLFILCK